ncbi:GHMP family kinase ATP-binding protein [Candidatus Hakubella thermalkaliphila]|uniref:L-threonine kinase n=3 Tax=Candidatus Hakubella thermalkaliphila TaxID=2754717 RepID=A0A6V8P586_9ACTN|nr:GHMP kinase [Candidatus Hakubella thermalkaliphila]GFP27503.1 L-threonine kinase [Candidatus Hakubella thermalkaliphila]GFP42029.1 L-threonine kinase [Candidatus Hakubella thermalkaliphila]
MASAPGSCGELVQGKIEGQNFHITCPIDLYSRARVEIQRSKEIVYPAGKPKAREAMRKTLDLFDGKNWGGRLEIFSDIPIAKGMASSTADIAAASLATALALGKEVTPDHISSIALSIEPTDGIMYEGIVLYDHLKRGLVEKLGLSPPVSIIILEPEERLETMVYNNGRPAYGEVEELLFERAVEIIRKGLKERDVQAIGQVATMSATINQKYLAKPLFEPVLNLAQVRGALGVNVAHSGTVMGILCDPEKTETAELLTDLYHLLPPGVKVRWKKLVAGGARVGW